VGANSISFRIDPSSALDGGGARPHESEFYELLKFQVQALLATVEGLDWQWPLLHVSEGGDVSETLNKN
jgi:hypothetical protein